MIRKALRLLLSIPCAAAVSALAQEPADRTDNAAPIVAPEAIPLPGTEGAPPACPFTIQGTLGSGSPEWPSVSGFQNGRLTRDGVASTCPTPGACVVFTATGAREYDAYTFINDTGVTRCVTVGLNVLTQTNCNLWVAGYLNTFDPNSLCTNYLGDTGSSSGIPPTPVSFSTNVPPGGNLILVVQDSNVGLCVGGVYDLTMSGECVPGPGLSFFTVPPCRLVDTRNPAGPLGGPALVANADRTFQLSGNCSVPATAKALSVNLAVTLPTVAGNLRLYPTGTPLPTISSINYSASQTRSNNAIVGLDALGQMTVRCAQAAGTAHFVLDVNGYFE